MADETIGDGEVIDDLLVNTGLRPRFFFMDIGAFIGLPPLIVHTRVWTFALALGLIVFFVILERRGLRPMGVVRIAIFRFGALGQWPVHIYRRRYHQRRLENR
jgi:Na+-transporting methylmalonyl-CoA/oxaloacetate decarboxylase beta subunit